MKVANLMLNRDYEAETRERLAYFRSVAPLTFPLLAGVTGGMAYFFWISWSLIVANFAAGVCCSLSYHFYSKNSNLVLAMVIFFLLLALVGTFALNAPPPGKIFRSTESRFYFCQAFSALGSGFFFAMLISRLSRKKPT